MRRASESQFEATIFRSPNRLRLMSNQPSAGRASMSKSCIPLALRPAASISKAAPETKPPRMITI